MMRTPGDTGPLGRPQTAHWHRPTVTAIRPLRQKTCWTPPRSQENQPSAGLPTSKDLHECESEKVHLPSIEDLQVNGSNSFNSSTDHPKGSRSAPVTRNAGFQSADSSSDCQSHLSGPSLGTIDCSGTKLSSNPSTHLVTAVPSNACRFLHSQSVSELNCSAPRDQSSTKPSTTSSTTGKIPWYLALLHEKEHCLLMLGHEISRLSEFEAESSKKDHVITALQEKVTELMNQLTLARNEDVVQAQAELILRLGNEVKHLRTFEEEVSRQKELIAELSEEIARLNLPRLQWECAAHTSKELENEATQFETQLETSPETCPATWQDSSTLSETETSSELEGVGQQKKELEHFHENLVKELEETKRKYKMSSGTVCILRRCLSVKEAELVKAGNRQERLRKELTDRALQLQAMSKKFSCLREGKINEELMADLENENFTQRKLTARLQQEIELKNKAVAEFKAEVHGLKQELAAQRAGMTELETDFRENQAKMASLQKIHNQTKVYLEQLQARFERFRGKIIQAAYCAPGAKFPLNEISDVEILRTMQKIIDDRSQFHQLLTQKGERMPPLFIMETQLPMKSKPISPKKN
ncbi:coiled-coil domain-containing protein 27 isoform X2 [Amia ocellicauda]